MLRQPPAPSLRTKPRPMKHYQLEKAQSPPAAGRQGPILETAQLPQAEAAKEEKRSQGHGWSARALAVDSGAFESTAANAPQKYM